MLRYCLSRVINAVVVVWAAFSISFLLLYLLPGDPISIMLMGESGNGAGGAAASAAQRLALAARYGFDLPPFQQYLLLLTKALHGDFGISMQSGKPVLAQIGEVLPETLKLSALSLAIALSAGVVLALLTSLRPAGRVRAMLLAIPSVSMSVPTFWIGLMLLQIFAFQLRLAPALGNSGFASLLLPSITLAVPTAALIAQTLSRSLDATLVAPFVTHLRAKGLPLRSLYLRHVLHNAAIPTITIIGLVVGSMFSGAVVTETVFSRAGAGRLLQGAVDVQDLPVVQGLVVLMAFAYAGINLVVDLIYPFIDPRIARGARTHG